MGYLSNATKMVKMEAQQRADNYIKEYPKYMPLGIFGDRIYGIWIVGNNYKRKNKYYGSYPHSIKERIYSLFPDCKNRLHLFSGTLEEDDGITYDVKPELKPTICDDVKNIKNHKNIFKDLDLVIADPPYEASDFEKYNLKPIGKAKVIKELGELMHSKSYLVWLDLRVPMYRQKCMATIRLYWNSRKH